MLLTLKANGKINTSSLPEEADGMRWIAESDAHCARRYGFVEAKDGVWVLSPKKGLRLADERGAVLERAALRSDAEQVFQLGVGEDAAALVVRPSSAGDRTYGIVGFSDDETITVGSAPDNVIRYESRFVSAHHARIDYVRDEFSITDLASSNGTFLNGTQLASGERMPLVPGDVVEVLGLVMAVGHRFLSFNDPANALAVSPTPRFVFFEQPAYEPPERIVGEDDDDADFFYPAPRFKRDVERRAFSVDAPPAPERADDTPVAMKIGPSMVMGLAAVFSGAVMFMRMQETGGSLLMAAPMLAMAVSLVLGSVLWPILAKRFEKKKAARAEARRRQAYAAYLDEIRSLIRDETVHQREVLEENRITVEECMRRAFERDPRLMDRTPAHDDFLELRLGTGTVPLAADIRYPDERFTVEKDDLTQVVYQLSREPKDIVGAPVAVSLADNPVVGVCGPADDVRDFAFGLTAQLACLHSYEDVKLVVLVEEDQREAWAWALALPHAFSDDKALRFAATTLEEASELGLVLGRVAEERREAAGKGQASPLPHYVVVCASKRLAGKSDLVAGLARRAAPGFTVVCTADERKDLPKQCTSIIEVGAAAGSIRAKGDASGKGLAFAPDAFADARSCAALRRALNLVRLDAASAKGALPSSLGFLEMYEAGNVEQLNVRARWKEAKASETLAARIGADSSGEPFYLNLHERFHGPHGLIAGTTGSGKSEFIITWILSMCVEYSPEEASFVLIDYKGGGLAGAFENERARLPHLAGTVTNLDGAAIARSLASIRSELKRRQALFNAARPAAGGGNVDIYKYLELYRAGKADEPCPHLFVVADEFAELKQQEPEFMDELVSAARIGRSLGVHLVLATQKPTGVVNDQIWSNSKFKACLKVADAADSKEMIKRPDAAELVDAGRFYLLVGYNEQFSLGQAAWAGAPYEPAEQFLPAADDSVALVSPTGRPLAQARPAHGSPGAEPVPQLAAVLGHLARAAEAEGLAARRLWLDPLPERVTVDGLAARYPDDHGRILSDGFSLEAIVGELDDPASQAKHLLTLPLSREGNAIVYGSAGSGAGALAAAALYSLLADHGPSELNVYVMDFGDEALGAFREAPQVGDVVFSGDEEKVENLFKMLQTETASRRRKLGRVGGDRGALFEATGELLPAILVVIEGFERFNELFERHLPALIELSRDGSRCGAYFMVTSSRANGVPYRVLPNFKQKLVLEMASSDEYLSVFGSMRGVVPSKGFERGLVKLDEGLFVFQGASVSEEEGSDLDCIRDYCREEAERFDETAVSVPMLPEIVDARMFAHYPVNMSSVPVGLAKDDLAVMALDFAKEPCWMIAGNDRDACLPLLKQVIRELSDHDVPHAVLDAVGDVDPACNPSEAVRALFSPDQEDGRGPRIVVVPSLAALQGALDSEGFGLFENYVEKRFGTSGHRFLLCDDAVDFSSFGIASWYKKLTGKGNGVWIGNGVTGQMLLKMARVGVRFDEDPDKGMGYFVYKNTATFIKHLMDAATKEA